MILSEMGKIVDQCWKEIPNHFENVMLDEFVVMSDHVHGIVFLERDAINRVSTSTSTSTSTTSTSMSKSTPTRGGITKNKNPMLFHNSLGKIIRWFKGRTTFEINKKYPYAGFQWQSLYYDHIIRDQRAFENIQQYICLNPQKWHDTRNFS
jgi:REP element-mobilizing transposase RayT